MASSNHSEHHHSSHHSSHHHSSHHSHSSGSKKSSKKKSKFKHSFRRPFSHITSIFLTFFVFVFFTLIAILGGAFSKSYITKIATGDEFIAQLYEAQLSEASALASDYNLPRSIFNNIITQDTLKAHMTDYVNAVLKGTGNIDLKDMQRSLTANIEAEIENAGLKNDENLKAKTTNFVLAFGEKYFSLLEINHLSTITALKIPFVIVFVICEILLALLIPISALLIDKTHRNSHKTTRQLAYAFLGGGMLTFAIPFSMRVFNLYGTLQVWQEYIYNFYMTYFNHIMNVWMLISLIPFALGAGFIVWTRYRKNKLKIKV